ncbi:MAG: signal peptidase I [Rhodobacteraceae bacterium]|nr:signal peptidase I [Paracoccaceae bacterium]
MASKENNSGGIAETFKTVFWALFLAGIIRTILFQPFWIPSGSMKPTLMIGDFLFVNKFTYGYSWASCPTVGGYNLCGFAKDWEGRMFQSEPERGDIIVFKHPASEADFIKRLIGLPGDKVQVLNGRLHINSQPVDLVATEDFVEEYGPQGPLGHRPRCANGAVGEGAICTKEAAEETLPGGVKHAVLNIGNSQGDNTGIYVVPEGKYFFMGDNRDNSTDSRFAQPYGVGMVSASYLVGRADRVMFSSAGSSILAFWTWRSDRYFKGLE